MTLTTKCKWFRQGLFICLAFGGLGCSISAQAAIGDAEIAAYLSGKPLNLDENIEVNVGIGVTQLITPTLGVVNIPNSTVANILIGIGSITKVGVGTLTLLGANTYSGGTLLSGGTIAVGHNTALGVGRLTMSAGTTLQAVASVTMANPVTLGGSSYVDTNGYALTLTGILSGAGSLVKASAGTLSVTGENTYAGGTTVNAGVLSVSGASPLGTGAVQVAAGASLGGTGTISGPVTVAGILKPGNSPGYLATGSSVTMTASSTYGQDIAGLAQASRSTPSGASGYYSYLNVASGQFVITAGSTLAPRLANLFTATEAGYGSAVYVPTLGDRMAIITASDGVSGRFTTVTQPAQLSSGTQLLALYNVADGKSVALVTVPTSYKSALAAGSGNVQAVASLLDSQLSRNQAGTATAVQDQLMYAVGGQTAASLPTFAQALAGEVHAASVAVLPQATQRVQQSVLARLLDYPAPATNASSAASNALVTSAISATNPTGLPTAAVNSNPAVNPNAESLTNASHAEGRVWGEIVYQRGDRASDSNASRYNSNLYQVVLGVDAYSNAELGLKLGGGLALSNTNVVANGGNSTIQQGSFFVYGKMPVAQEYVLDAMTSVGLSSTDLSRSDITGISGGFKNKAVIGNDILASLGISRPIESHDLRITPYARVTYQYLTQSAYNEGNSGAALDIGRYSGSGVRGVLGVALGSLNKDPLKDQYTYRVNVAVGADSQGLLNPSLSTTLAGYSTSTLTPNAGAAFLQAGLYGTVKVSDSLYAYAAVAGEVRSGQTLYGGSLGLRLAF